MEESNIEESNIEELKWDALAAPPPANEIDGRVSALAEQLRRMNMDCAFLTQNADRFYYTGTLQDGILMVHAEHPPVLFIKRTLSRAREESPLRDIVNYRSTGEIKAFMDDNRLPSLVVGMTMDVVPAKLYLAFRELFPDAAFVDVSWSVRIQRAVKSRYELGLLREGGKRFDRVLERLKGYIRPGISEYELYMIFTRLLQEEGSSIFIRTRMYNMEAEPKYILSGESASKRSAMDSPTASGDGISRAFPSGAGRRQVRENETVVVDAVFVYEGYIVDCTRVYAVKRLDDRLIKAHEVSVSCHGLFRKKALPGIYVPDLYRDILARVQSEGLEDVFMGGVKFAGHGVGLELDELPVVSERFEGHLQEGMVVAFEPKFVFEDGCAGFENTYVIENGGVRSLTLSPEGIQFL